MKEFKINEYITLKLEDGITKIYVKGDDYPFLYCASLLMRKTVYELDGLLKEIESIDEIAEHLENYRPEKINIPVKTEFWGHCSNLQVWVENNYDTHLIHSNLAFPLLKKLTEAGDPIAKKVFREEIAKRINSGYLPVIKFLIDEKYIDYLEKEELETIYLDANPKLHEALTMSLENREKDSEQIIIGKKSSLEKFCRPIIKKLIELGDSSAIKFIKKNFTESIKSRDFSLSLRIIHNLDVKGPRIFYLENNPALNEYILEIIHNKEKFIKYIKESYNLKSRILLSKIKSLEKLKHMTSVLAYNSSFINRKNIEFPPVNEELMERYLIFQIILTLAWRGDTSAIKIYESLKQTILLDPFGKKVIQFIENNPGMYKKDIIKILKERYGKSNLEAERLIYLLKRFNFIKGVPHTYGSAILPYRMDDRIGELYFILRDDLSRKIIKLLLDIPQIEFLELKKKFGESENKIHKIIVTLEKAKLLVEIDETSKEREDFFIEIRPENSKKCEKIIKDLETLESF